MMGSTLVVTAAMVAVECFEVGLNTLSKAAMSKGMSDFVFVVYSNAFAIPILLSSSLYFYRKRSPTPPSFRIICRIFLLGLISYMVMEVFLDPNKDHTGVDDPIIITQLNLSKAIKQSILLNFGEYGLASSLGSFQVKYVNPQTKLCIIRASLEEYQKVWSAITMVRNIGNCPVLFNLLDLSGNIRACKKAALKCDEMKFEQYKLKMGTLVSADVTQHIQNCLEKIKLLEN